MTNETDSGPIVAQCVVGVLPDDTPESLGARIFPLARDLVLQASAGMPPVAYDVAAHRSSSTAPATAISVGTCVMKRCLECFREWQRDGWTCPRCGFTPATIGGYPAFAPELAAENANYPTGYFDVLSEVDRSHFWFRARGAMVTWAIRRHFASPRSVMEIGCGVGGMLARSARLFPTRP